MNKTDPNTPKYTATIQLALKEHKEHIAKDDHYEQDITFGPNDRYLHGKLGDILELGLRAEFINYLQLGIGTYLRVDEHTHLLLLEEL